MSIPSDEERGAPETEAASVTVIIPCRAEYVGIARLAILGVANRLDFSYDEVEDVRLAVGEACSHAIERARTASANANATIRIDSQVTPESLTIVVHDTVPAASDGEVAAPGAMTSADDLDEIDIDRQDLGALLMEILVDSVTVESGESGTTVTLYKASPNYSAPVGA